MADFIEMDTISREDNVADDYDGLDLVTDESSFLLDNVNVNTTYEPPASLNTREQKTAVNK